MQKVQGDLDQREKVPGHQNPHLPASTLLVYPTQTRQQSAQNNVRRIFNYCSRLRKKSSHLHQSRNTNHNFERQLIQATQFFNLIPELVHLVGSPQNNKKTTTARDPALLLHQGSTHLQLGTTSLLAVILHLRRDPQPQRTPRLQRAVHQLSFLQPSKTPHLHISPHLVVTIIRLQQTR